MEGTVNHYLIFVGKKKVLRKDKSGYCYIVSYLCPYNDVQLQKGNLGFFPRESFVSEEVWNFFTSACLHKKFVFTYEMGLFNVPEINGFRLLEK